MFGSSVRFFQQNCQNCILFVQTNTCNKEVFRNKIFHLFFWTLLRKPENFAKIFKISLPALTKLHLCVHRIVFRKKMISGKDVIFLVVFFEVFRTFNEFCRTFDEFFAAGLSNNIQSVQRKIL